MLQIDLYTEITCPWCIDPAQLERVEQEAAKSAAAGVRSVPHFVFGNRVSINGGRSEDEIAAAIQQAREA